MSDVVLQWRGEFDNLEVHRLHAEAFETRVFDESEWNWLELTARHSLGWVTARRDGQLVGFANVLWDGLVHAWLEDVMVALAARRQRIGVRLVHAARDGTARAGCDFLHVSFDERLRRFYIDECGFGAVGGGLMELHRTLPPTPAAEDH
jgi:GNAT superfamily N-acetyltransferase